MAEPGFDLVPREYRLERALHKWLRRLGALLGSVVIAATASGAALAYAATSLDAQIRQLQTQNAMTSQQRAQLESLDAHIAELTAQWQLLTTLRSGAPAERIFVVIDAALDTSDVWFQEWAFTRAGAGAGEPPATVNTGYFIVVPDAQEATPPPAWRIETHIRIRGQARDHAALSRFVRALFGRDEVRDVRVQRTTLRRFVSASVVDFELAIVLDGGEQA